MRFCGGEGEFLLVSISICIITSWLILIDIVGTGTDGVGAEDATAGGRSRYCSLNSPEVYSSAPKIRFEYDGRHFNSTIKKIYRKSSARDNNIYLVCHANYPVLFRAGQHMLEKALKFFSDNLITFCKNEKQLEIHSKPECLRYEVKTSLPVHHLDENEISAQCESFCNQVELGTKIRIWEERKEIKGNVSPYKIKGRGNVTFVPQTTTIDPLKLEDNKTFAEKMREAAVDVDLIQIYTSPEGKSWNIKCTTSSALTAAGAWLLLKLRDFNYLHIANHTKEYRRAGIHTIRTQYNDPLAVEFFLCLFPRLNDFTWISKSDKIDYEDPMTYWECVLHFCGYFVSAFILFVGVCFGIHRWLHSDCLNHKSGGMSIASARSSQQQLHQQKQLPHRQWSSSIEEEYQPEAVTGSSTESSISSRNPDNQGQIVEVEEEHHHHHHQEEDDEEEESGDDDDAEGDDQFHSKEIV